MAIPPNRWENPHALQNASQILQSSTAFQHGGLTRNAPILPPRPNSMFPSSNYGGSSMGMGYSPYGQPSYMGMGLGGYGSRYGMSSSMYGSGYNNYSNYNNYGMSTYPDDAERRFIQYAEESSRNTFANVESIVRAFNSIAMMLDNTFFAMTSSFRAVLSVADNFGRLRSMFGHIWHSLNIFRFVSWMYRKLMGRGASRSSLAWVEAANGAPLPSSKSGSNWPTLAFLGACLSIPYIVSKLLPKYEDKSNPETWKSSGIKAKAVFDFIATHPNELTMQANDLLTLAPTYIQEEMKLKNTGWAFAIYNGKSGVVPLNYLVINKSNPSITTPPVFPPAKTHAKKVSFGETQIFENIDLKDFVTEVKKDTASQDKELKSSIKKVDNNNVDEKVTADNS